MADAQPAPYAAPPAPLTAASEAVSMPTPESTANAPATAPLAAAGDALAVRLIQVDGTGTPIRRIPTDQARLKTGDRFTVEFVTSLPGLVAVSNINPKGALTPLDRYYVVGGVVNRLPHAFRMQGTPGRETFRLEFVPCRDPQRRGQTHASGADAYAGLTNPVFVEAMPLCDVQGEAPMSRDIVKEELINGAQVVVGAYQGGTARMIPTEIYIEHVAP